MSRRSRHHVGSGPLTDGGALVGPGSQGDPGGEVSPEIVMFFLGPDGEFLADDPHAAPRHTLADVRRAWHAALESEAAHDPFAAQPAGPATGAGHRTSVQVGLPRRDRRHRECEPGSARSRPRSCPSCSRRPSAVCSSTSRRSRAAATSSPGTRGLALWPWQHRPVRLRLYASPSLNVTVLALSPAKARPAARRRFLRVGNRVMNELRDRVDAAVTSDA